MNHNVDLVEMTDASTASPSRKLLPRTVSVGSTSSAKNSPARGGKKKSTSLPPETVEYLKNWILSPEHIAHPYPTEQEKAQIMQDTGIELKQLTNWFVNNRKRFWKPHVEARLREQQKSAGATSTASPSKIVKTVSTGNLSQLSRTNSSDASSGSASPIISPGHLISAESSVTSETNSVTDTEGFDGYSSAGQTTEEFVSRTETIQIHILRPLVGTSAPSIEDVTILTNIPGERILHTYNDCLLTYRCSAADAQDPKKLQRPRDTEVVRLKKYYLKLFNSQHSSLGEGEPLLSLTAKRKRTNAPAVIEDDVVECVPRTKFRRASVQLWKEACQTADCVYGNELPSLEEATTLFGFAAN